MNPRQRRGALFLVLSALGALGVFGLVVTYVGDVNAQVGNLATVYRVSNDLPALSEVTPGDVERAEVPERWLTDDVVRSLNELEGQVTAAEVRAGSSLSSGMFIERPRLTAGQREIAILIDAETGVAGKVRPGDLVDIYATFPGLDEQPPFARVVVANARVLDIGGAEDVSREDTEGNLQEGRAIPVTFALSKQQSLDLALAESAATKVRLALIAPGDASGPGDVTVVTPQGPAPQGAAVQAAP